jgi:hypothetical protein
MILMLTIAYRLLWVIEIAMAVIPMGFYFAALLSSKGFSEGKEFLAFLVLVGSQVVVVGLLHFILTGPIGKKLAESIDAKSHK